MTKIVCISNLEGYLPEELPCGDVLVIAGASFPFSRILDRNEQLISQVIFWDSIFRPWLKLQVNIFDKILITYGYTDLLPYCAYTYRMPDYIAALSKRLIFPDNVMDITNKTYEYKPKNSDKVIKFFGSPFSFEPAKSNYAFISSEDELSKSWNCIPKDTEILVTHEAPLNCSSTFFGSKSLEEVSKSLPLLKYHIYGHSHYRIRKISNGKTYINCSYTEYAPGVLEYENNYTTLKFKPSSSPIETFVY